MNRTRGRSVLRYTLIYVAVALVLVGTLAPVVWMFISSISQGTDLLSMPPRWFPEAPNFERYEAILLGKDVKLWGAQVTASGADFLHGLTNSLLVASITTLVSLTFGLFASFALVKLRFRWKRAALISVMSVQMLPAIATVIPLFILIRRLFPELINSPLALILIYSAMTVTYVIWILAGYLGNLPREIEEAALLDGCSYFQAMLRVTLPIARPGLIAVGTLAFMMAWNEFLYALVFTHSSASKTMPVVISEFSSRFGLDYGMAMTGGVLVSIPPVLLALLFQRYIVRGLAAGAVRG